MKIYIDLPWGGELVIERQPMSGEKFDSVCLLVGVLGVVSLMVALLTSAVG